MLKKEQILEACCVKCRGNKEIKEPQTLKNSKPALQGACPICGTKIFRVGKG
jgi:hypothetical protein